jgi:D-alanyl-D-alanine carboxypeptidase (penicillin-binding protein 5/6)
MMLVRRIRLSARSLLLVLAAGCVLGFRPPVLLPGSLSDADGLGAIGPVGLSRAIVPAVPTVPASGVAVVDGDSGALVWGKNVHTAWAPASLTKIMTALLALQAGHLDQIVTSGVDASKLTGDSVMGLHLTERLSLRDLLYGLLVPSGDDAAIVIAEAVGGSQPAFVSQMNAEASRLGLTDTHFANPHGLDAAGHVASPYDMLVMTQAAMQNPLFRQIVATRQITIQGHWIYNLTNTNVFLGRRPGVIGVKTGHTDNALSAITIADQQNGHLLYLTVMHTPNYVPDVTSLLDYFEANDTWATLSLPDTPLAQTGDPSHPRKLAVAGSATAYLPRWRAASVSVQLALGRDSALRATDNPDLPSADEGTATFYAGGDPLARLPLVLQ